MSSDVEDGELISSDDEVEEEIRTDAEVKKEANKVDINLSRSRIYEIDSNYQNNKNNLKRKAGGQLNNFNSENCKRRIVDTNNYKENNCSLNAKKKVLCKYYVSGECKNRQTCPFMHEDFPCKFHHSELGVCRQGNQCKYSHAALSEDMRLVFESFVGSANIINSGIVDTKEKENHIKVSIEDKQQNNNNSNNRPRCLLPTPDDSIEQNTATSNCIKSDNVLDQLHMIKPNYNNGITKPPLYNVTTVNNNTVANTNSTHHKSRFSDVPVCPPTGNDTDNNKTKYILFPPPARGQPIMRDTHYRSTAASVTAASVANNPRTATASTASVQQQQQQQFRPDITQPPPNLPPTADMSMAYPPPYLSTVTTVTSGSVPVVSILNSTHSSNPPPPYAEPLMPANQQKNGLKIAPAREILYSNNPPKDVKINNLRTMKQKINGAISVLNLVHKSKLKSPSIQPSSSEVPFVYVKEPVVWTELLEEEEEQNRPSFQSMEPDHHHQTAAATSLASPVELVPWNPIKLCTINPSKYADYEIMRPETVHPRPDLDPRLLCNPVIDLWNKPLKLQLLQYHENSSSLSDDYVLVTNIFGDLLRKSKIS